MRPIDVHGVPVGSPTVGVRSLALPSQSQVHHMALVQACDIVRHCMTPDELTRWFPPPPPPCAHDTLELHVVELDTLAPPTTELPGWALRLLETVNDGQRAELLCDFIGLLLEHDGRALVAALSNALRLTPLDIRSMVASLGARINTTAAFPLLGYDADGDTVVMNVSALAEQFEVNARKFRVFRPGGKAVVFELPCDPSDVERKALEHLARYQRLSEAELSRLCGTRRIGGLMQMLMERLSLAGWQALSEEAAGDDGRVYAFRDEKL